jgi:ABC-2 type transport system ATP-binding protein
MIEVDHLSKQYGRTAAVRDVSFTCRAGTVTGFLGPNGAGKSTTLRLICGLAAPSGGTARVLGVPFRELPSPGGRVGVLLDASGLHGGRTGEETLRVAVDTMDLNREVIAPMLERVGLAGAASTRVGKYSLGMRQRLGLAQALIGDPAVLILDEPVNGLDPQGIVWMRRLLRDFADRAGTVLLSSHLLHEIDALADQVVVITAGQVVAQGSKDDLLAGTGGGLEELFLRVTAGEQR